MRNVCCCAQCDDVPLDIVNGMTLECIAIMNISSIYGGSDLWGSDGQRKQDTVGTRFSAELSDSSDILKDVDLARVEQGRDSDSISVDFLKNK